jgi:hypothetical protein
MRVHPWVCTQLPGPVGVLCTEVRAGPGVSVMEPSRS